MNVRRLATGLVLAAALLGAGCEKCFHKPPCGASAAPPCGCAGAPGPAPVPLGAPPGAPPVGAPVGP